MTHTSTHRSPGAAAARLALRLAVGGTLLAPAVAAGVRGAFASPSTAAGSPAIAGAADTAHLVTALDDSGATVTGPHFMLRWSAARGGDLTSIRVHDGFEWHELLGTGRVRSTVPGLRIVTAAADYREAGVARLRWVERAPDRAVLAVEAVPATGEGAASPFVVRQTYTVYVEGAVFVDLEIELPAGAGPVELERASIGWPVATGDFDLTRWHWRGDLQRGAFFLKRQPALRVSRCPNVGLALGVGREFLHHVQLVLERERPFGESGLPTGALVVDGSYIIFHLRPRKSGPVTLEAPYRYSNRWGFLLGRQPRCSALIGQRLVYWWEGGWEGGETGMAFPSPSALEAMAQCGASGVVLGPGWRRALGVEGNLPVDREAMRRMIDDAHGMGLRVIAYTVAGDDADELAAWARAQGLDGLFLDQTSPHLGLIRDGDADYAAKAAFEWARRLKHGLGPGSLLLGRDGVLGPDLAMALVVPGVVYGRDSGEMRAPRDQLLADYLGGQGYGIPCPLAFDTPLRSERAAAAYAAAGAVPLVVLGYGEERSAYRGARWALPLWQIYRTLPMGRDVQVPGGAIGRYLRLSNPGFRGRVYRQSADVVLVVGASRSAARVDSTVFLLDYDALGLDGAYAIEEVRGLALEEIESIYLGRSVDGRIYSEPIRRWGLRGLLLLRGDYPPAIARGLDALSRVARAFGDDRPPVLATAPTVEPGDVALHLRWEPATDDHHVEAYRIYRSRSADFAPGTVEEVGLVFETTRFRDLDVEPGREWHYAVAPIDQAGNEGRPSPSASATLPLAERVVTFAGPADLDRLELLSGVWEVTEGTLQLSHAGTGALSPRAIVRGATYPEVDLRVRISARGDYGYAGGVLFRATDSGDGYALYLGGSKNNRLVLEAFEGDRRRRLADVFYPYVRPVPGGGRRTLRVVAAGSRIAAYCDDRLLIEVEDSTFAGGGVGLVGLGGVVRFDNLMVDRAGDGRP